MKAKLRKKLEEEKRQRDAELIEIEKARQAEEALRKQNSTSEQLKRAVSERMSRNSEKLKQVMNEQFGDKTGKLKNVLGKFKSQISSKKSDA